MKTTMKKPNTTKQKPAAVKRENATAFIHLKIKPSELAALKLAAGKQPFGAWVREACQAHGTRHRVLYRLQSTLQTPSAWTDGLTEIEWLRNVRNEAQGIIRETLENKVLTS